MLLYTSGGWGKNAVLFPYYFAEITPGSVTPLGTPQSSTARTPLPQRSAPRTPLPAAHLRGPQGAAAGSLRRWISSLSIPRRSPQPGCGTKLNLPGSLLFPPPHFFFFSFVPFILFNSSPARCTGRARSPAERHRAAPRCPPADFK